MYHSFQLHAHINVMQIDCQFYFQLVSMTECLVSLIIGLKEIYKIFYLSIEEKEKRLNMT